ncbi:MAG: septum site-determining protein MinD [Helicobacteraceae bacterium]|nr:septum site-determining protein MinD [Helicobacteraceae bacterium]
MGQVITITSGKGGVGKSTAAANISTAIAEADKKVVAIDFDIGLRNLDMILGLENRIVYDSIDVMEGRVRLNQALINDKRVKSLFFLPASQTRDKSVLESKKVEALIGELKRSFEYVIIDSPAGIESGFEHAVYLADIALIVTTPEVSAVRDADRVIGIIDAKSKKAKEGGEVVKKLIINRIKPDMIKKGQMLSPEDVLQILAIDLIGLVPDDELVVVATNTGEVVIRNPKSESGGAYRRIAKRILGEEVAFASLETSKGIGGFIKGLFK